MGFCRTKGKIPLKLYYRSIIQKNRQKKNKTSLFTLGLQMLRSQDWGMNEGGWEIQWNDILAKTRSIISGFNGKRFERPIITSGGTRLAISITIKQAEVFYFAHACESGRLLVSYVLNFRWITRFLIAFNRLKVDLGASPQMWELYSISGCIREL